MRIACVLLAAGLGTRMGGDKLLKKVRGEALIARAASLAAALPFSAKVAVVRPGDAGVINAAEGAGLTPVANPNPTRGIASSLVIGLDAAIKSGADGALFLVADQPELRKETVGAMLTLFEAHPEAIIRPASADGTAGNPVLFPMALFGELMQLTGDTGGKAVIRNHPERVLTVLCEKAELRDVDTPRDIGG